MFTAPGRRSCRSRRTTRKGFQTLGATAMLLALVLQLTFSLSATDAQQPECDEGEEYNPLTGQCEVIEEEIPVATGEPMPTEEPTEAPTEEPTEEATEPSTEPTDPVSTELAELYVYKWTCEPGYNYQDPNNDFEKDCDDSPTNGVTFSLFTPDGQTLMTNTGDSVDGAVYFGGLVPGDYTITESVPDGTEAYAVLNCPTNADDAPVMPVTSSELSIDIPVNYGDVIICDWINFPADPNMPDATPVTGEDEGYADLYIYKWECPAGYDPLAQGAFPMVDCTTPLNGVTFTLEGSGDFPIQTDTGDSQDGMVMFGGQETGDWVITETMPDGYESAFVYECNGLTDDMVHPTPLQMGNVLEMHPADGDSITCNWFNIPEDKDGKIIVQKYLCEGETFIHDVECEIYEGGVDFKLTAKDATTEEWSDYGVATTDEYGQITWDDLPAGSYGIEEIGSTPCFIEINRYDEDKNIAVLEGDVTLVEIYNCGWEDHEPNKSPEQWPNTGALQAETDCPAVSAPNTPAESTPDTEFVDQGCNRGMLPVAISIDAIDVETDVEVLETVNGVMQAPTGPQVVSWYKETARLGENGNIVLAGHLNYWGVPEGVFYDLASLEEGDMITLHDLHGAGYEYEVVSVEQVGRDASPTEVLDSPDDEEMLTLITCGGEWDASSSEYDERTIVKAKRVS